MAADSGFDFYSIVRSVPANTREARGEPSAKRRNPANPILHPFQQAREYVRALNAVKLDRLFAKPLVGVLEGHRDGLYAMALDPQGHLRRVVTGSADGDLRLWDLLRPKRSLCTIPDAHSAFIRAVCLVPDFRDGGDDEGASGGSMGYADSGEVLFYSASDDHTVKLWSVDSACSSDASSSLHANGLHEHSSHRHSLRATFECEGVVLDVDHHRTQDLWMTAGADGVLEWTSARSQPLRRYAYAPHSQHSSCNSFVSLRMNASDSALFVASGAMDRSVVVGDRRSASPIARQVLANKTNALCWNWMAQPTVFACGNEDGKAYTFDLRQLAKPLQICVDHVAPIMSVDYDPTGTTLATGSWDRTVRLYDISRSGRTIVSSRDVYHAMRMQRVWVARFTGDGAYVLSGSDDGNVRVWKTHASRPLGPVSSAERHALDYRQQLVEKFGALPEIKRISRHRHVPKAIKAKQRQDAEQRASQQLKAENRIKHSRDKTARLPAASDKVVLSVDSNDLH